MVANLDAHKQMLSNIESVYIYMYICDTGGAFCFFVLLTWVPNPQFWSCVMYRVGALEDGLLPFYTTGSPGEQPAVALLACNSSDLGPTS